ncbi:hypothetical protein [Spongiactinospora rosea]|uniref:hypothetical protein n=1 Tax=Spongiactinospora rosea TaxID=2248750 RepID=UPI0018F4E3CA|nr:hypothetical protein [Spongiactinospora rosea]
MTPVATLLLAEYSALKAEQAARIGHRDQLVYAMLTAVAAIATVAVSAARAELLLVLPLASVAIGWTFLVNDHMITAIGRYLRDDLGPHLALAAGDADAVLGWEFDHIADRRRRSRKRYQLAVDLSVFCLPPLVALGVVLATAFSPATLTAGLVEMAAVAVLARQIIAYADLKRPTHDPLTITQGATSSAKNPAAPCHPTPCTEHEVTPS